MKTYWNTQNQYVIFKWTIITRRISNSKREDYNKKLLIPTLLFNYGD